MAARTSPPSCVGVSRPPACGTDEARMAGTRPAMTDSHASAIPHSHAYGHDPAGGGLAVPIALYTVRYRARIAASSERKISGDAP